MTSAEFEHDGIRVRWSPHERVVEFRYEDDRRLTTEAADVIIPVVAGWVGEREAYGILVDARNTVESNDGWRKRWAAFHGTHAERVRIAIFRAGPFIRGFLAVYSAWSRVPLRCFPNEREARAWLAEGLAPAMA